MYMFHISTTTATPKTNVTITSYNNNNPKSKIKQVYQRVVHHHRRRRHRLKKDTNHSIKNIEETNHQQAKIQLKKLIKARKILQNNLLRCVRNERFVNSYPSSPFGRQYIPSSNYRSKKNPLVDTLYCLMQDLDDQMSSLYIK